MKLDLSPFGIDEVVKLAKLIILIALLPTGFVLGCMDEKERFDAYRDKVKAAGEAQEERTRARIAQDKQLTKDADDDHKKRMADLNGELASLKLRLSSRPSIVPPATGAAPGGQGLESTIAVVCFARDRLAEGVGAALQRFGERAVGSLQLGARAIETVETCSAWALKEDRGALVPTKPVND